MAFYNPAKKYEPNGGNIEVNETMMPLFQPPRSPSYYLEPLRIRSQSLPSDASRTVPSLNTPGTSSEPTHSKAESGVSKLFSLTVQDDECCEIVLEKGPKTPEFVDISSNEEPDRPNYFKQKDKIVLMPPPSVDENSISSSDSNPTSPDLAVAETPLVCLPSLAPSSMLSQVSFNTPAVEERPPIIDDEPPETPHRLRPPTPNLLILPRKRPRTPDDDPTPSPSSSSVWHSPNGREIRAASFCACGKLRTFRTHWSEGVAEVAMTAYGTCAACGLKFKQTFGQEDA